MIPFSSNLLVPWLVLFSSASLGQARLWSILGRSDADAEKPLSSSQPEHVDKFFKFVTRPDLQAPRWNITIFDEAALEDGYWFVAPYARLDETEILPWNGPYIYRNDGELVWSGTSKFEHLNTFDFRTAIVNGETKLTLLYPDAERKAGIVLGADYEIEKAVDFIHDDEGVNMHDFKVIADGERALALTALDGNSTIAESRVIGFDGECCASWEGFRELDVDTSKILFEWSAHGHIGLDESTRMKDTYEEMCRQCWDILHLNSIDKFPDGDYLVSSRHTDTIYKISHRDKSIVWRLGGKKSDFEFVPNAKFTRQHHARILSQNSTHTVLSVFNNAKGNGKNEHKSSDMSRGLILGLQTDAHPMTVELLQSFDHPDGLITNSRGSFEILPNGNAFIGWTYGSLLSEHSADGTLLMRAKFLEGKAHNYRAFKLPWVGRPSNPPDIHSASESEGGRTQTIVHVSWNGATEVAMWKLYNVNAEGSQRDVIATIPSQGFESAFVHAGQAKYVQAEGYDVDGHLLGSSKITLTKSSGGWLAELSLGKVGVAVFFVILACAAAAIVLRTGVASEARRRLGWYFERREYAKLDEAIQDYEDWCGAKTEELKIRESEVEAV